MPDTQLVSDRSQVWLWRRLRPVGGVVRGGSLSRTGGMGTGGVYFIERSNYSGRTQEAASRGRRGRQVGTSAASATAAEVRIRGDAGRRTDRRVPGSSLRFRLAQQRPGFSSRCKVDTGDRAVVSTAGPARGRTSGGRSSGCRSGRRCSPRRQLAGASMETLATFAVQFRHSGFTVDALGYAPRTNRRRRFQWAWKTPAKASELVSE